MKSFIKIVSVFLLVYLIISCSSGNRVTVESFSPTGKVERLTNIVVEFSEDLAPADMRDKWLDEEFIEFTPKIAGKFKWISPSTLVFSPEGQLEPIQEYSAKITDKVLFGSNFSPDFDKYNFHTPDFDVTSVDFFWTNIPRQDYQLSVKANIHFNYPVDPAELRDYLEVKKEGETVNDYNIMADESAEVIAINFGEIKQTEKEQSFSINIKYGLQSVLKKKGLVEDRSFKSNLPPITELAITGLSSGFDGNTGWIEVSTTQTVDSDVLKDFISTAPKKRLIFFVNDNGFRIETNLEDVQTVELVIKKGLPGLYGGKLEFDYEQTVSMVNVNPSINFADKKGKYMMLSGEKNLRVNAVNMDEAEIEVSKVYKNNLLHFLNRYTYYYYDDYYYNPSYYVEDYGKLLYSKKIKLNAGKNWLQSFDVNLSEALNKKYRGIFVVNVHSSENRWTQDSKMLAISDLGIITKSAGNQIMVFVNSIETTNPVKDVQVDVISTNNQVLLSGKTNEEGVITFNNLKDKIEGFFPRLILVQKDEDFNYIDFNETLIETSRYDVGGRTQYNENYNSFVYSERNLYRPGETVNLSAIVRGDMMELVTDIPVLIKIITPTGKAFEEFKKELNEQGSFELNFQIPDYAQTGDYRAEVYTGSKQLIGSYRFSIEEFIPDKIRVAVNSDKESVFPDENINIDVDAEFLFGSKASGLKYESDLIMKHRPFRSEAFPEYNFSNSSIKNPDFENNLVEGKLDENGHAIINYEIPNSVYGSGLITGSAFVSVFDLTGRAVTRAASFDIYPKDYFIGIKAQGYYFGTNENLAFQIVAVNKNDQLIEKFRSNVVLVRYEWHTVLKKNYSGQYYYASERKPVVEWERKLTIDKNPANLKFTLTRSGKYELRVSKEGSKDYQIKDFYAYSWGSSTASSFEVDKEGRIEIVADKKEYQPGENAKLLFTTPFSGKMLVTFERNNVFEYRYVNVENRSAEVNVKLMDDHMPNVYVTATLFKEHSTKQETPFLVGHGFISLKVIEKDNILPVSIIAPEKIKPRTKQEITIKTTAEKDIFITLAAVDEGILQIKNYETPDPFEFMYAKRKLGVNSYDLYKLLLPEIVSSSSSPGGDDILLKQLQKRTNPIKAKRFKLLSYWSGIKKTNSSGEVKISLDIPQFNGDVRLMAVAYEGARFGSTDENMKVAEDIILEPQIPRFLSFGDTLVAPVSVINTTDKSVSVNISLQVEGPLKIQSSNTNSVNIKPNSTGQTVFRLSADNIGTGKIIIRSSGPVDVKEEIDIGVRPVSPLIVETGSGTIKAGETVTLNIPTNFLENTQNTSITLSKFPAIKFAKQLKYLVGYPHGCIEQTVSKLFPQLYFEEIAKLIAPEYYKTTNPVYYVKEGIRKIESMQMFDGSMLYWPGGHNTNWWGSVYAAHFLVETKKAGFNVSQSVLNKLLNYLSKEAKTHKTYDYVHYRNNSRTIQKIARKEIIYSLYVLALAGEGDISTMNYYKARPHLLSADMLYLLAGSYALMDRWNSYYEIVPGSYQPIYPERLNGGNFDSELRANAIMLNVLLEVEPSSPQIPYMIKYLSAHSENLYSTQERAFTFLALGKAASQKSDSDIKIVVKSNGEVVGEYNNIDVTIDNEKLNKSTVTLSAQGTGEVYYYWSSEGIKVGEKVKEEDSYLSVDRTYYNYKTGDRITNNQFNQGDLIVCKISLKSFDRSAENIVIADLIPAGFEIENPRLSAATELQWKPKFPLDVEYMDIRDDRLLLFTNLKRRITREYYYMLRVVNQGIYQLPVISAEAMYDREFHSYYGAGVINISASE